MALLADWQLEPAVTVGVLGAGLLFVCAERRVARGRGRAEHPWRRRCFLAGLVTIFVALESPIDARAETSFALHMLQHLLLTMVAAPLLVLGAPLSLALRAGSTATRRRVVAVLRSAPARVISSPLTAWALFFAVLWTTHMSVIYEATLRSGRIHDVEHLAYLGTALLFWTPVAGVEPAWVRLSHPARIFYLFLAMPAMAFLGLAIFSAHAVLYPTYAAVEGVRSALRDQRMAGALMWNGGMFLIVPALAFVLFDWMRADDREARRIDERLRDRARLPVAEGPEP